MIRTITETTPVFPRNLAPRLLQALGDTPVVLLNGARQTGKSTLVQALAAERHPARYLTLDDAAVLAAAQASPADFVAGLTSPVILDEVQRAPALFLALKAEVDRNRRPGRFLLTGSADVLLLPRLSESLAGRLEVLTLWTLSQGELERQREGFIDACFAEAALPAPSGPGVSRDGVIARVLRGGYPEAVRRESEERRNAWFGAYVTTVLQRDVRDLASIERLADLPRLLALVAARSGTLLNFAELSRSSGTPQTSLKRYMALLEATFLIQFVPAWSGNFGKRLTRAPKLFLGDTGLLASLLGLDASRLAQPGGVLGRILETFVALELRKQIGWSRVQPRLYHFRSHSGEEVDLVLEDAGGRLVGIEVKAAATIDERDFRHLRRLEELAGGAFRRGILLYTGAEALSFGSKLHALPLDALWRLGAVAAGP